MSIRVSDNTASSDKAKSCALSVCLSARQFYDMIYLAPFFYDTGERKKLPPNFVPWPDRYYYNTKSGHN